jgi:HEAT repeat protein
MRYLVLICLATVPLVSSTGCGKRQPMLAGGKPVGAWVQALQDPDARVRKQAAFKLGNVGPADPAALPALIGALKDPHAAVRREAILAVLKCGPAARDAGPVLLELQRNDRDAQVRGYAAQALDKLQGSSR